jgi:MFS family permease
MFKFDAEFRAEFQQHWLVLLIAFLTFMFGFSVPAFALPFIFPEVIEHFGWTREQATLLASAKFVVGAVCSLLVGRFVDKTGAWASLIVTVALGGVALLSFLWIDSLAVYYLSGIFLGFASGGTMVAIKVLISKAFHHSQATAMGLALMGSVVGSIGLPFAIGAAIDAFGWRIGIALMSTGIWLVAVPMLLLGLVLPSMAFGRRPKITGSAESIAAAALEKSAVLRAILRERRFWIVAVSVFLVALVDQAFLQHQVMIYKDAGLDRQMTEIAVSAIGVAGIASRLIVGNIIDANSNRGLAVLWTILSASVLLAFAVANPILLMAYVLFRAVGHSAVLLDTVTMTKHVWGISPHMGTLLGMFTAVVSVGFAIGPWLMGMLFDRTGSYATSFILFSVLPLVAGLLIWRIDPVFWRQLQAGKRAAADSAATAALQPSRR